MTTNATPEKEYSTRDTNYAPGETVAKARSKTSVITALKQYSAAIERCTAENFSASAKLGPQGRRKEKEYPGEIRPSAVAEKMDRYDEVTAYVSEVRDDGTQLVRIRVGDVRASTYTFEVVFDATTVRWEP